MKLNDHDAKAFQGLVAEIKNDPIFGTFNIHLQYSVFA
jgi:hypothetical protein